MMNRRQPSHANGFRFGRAERFFLFVAAVFMYSIHGAPRDNWQLFAQALFYFFLESNFRIGESEQKLGPIAFLHKTVSWGMTP
jgi:hypothetical protein